MSIAEIRREQTLPCLSDARIAMAEQFAPSSPHDFAATEILFGLETRETAAWL